MKNWGILLIIVGAMTVAGALLFMPSTVKTEDMRYLEAIGSSIGAGTFSDTYNMPRAQLRELIAQLGEFMFLAGVVLYAGGRIEDRLTRSISVGDAPHVEHFRTESASESDREDPPVSGAKIAVGILGIGALIGVLILFARVNVTQEVTSADAMNAANAAENASQAADNAMNAAMNAADNAMGAAR